MSKKSLKEAVLTYLSAHDEQEATALSIMKGLSKHYPSLKKRELNRLLYNDEDFTSTTRLGESKPYWRANNMIEIERSDELIVADDQVHVFVDCDNSSTMFFYLVNNVKNGALFVHGYSGPCYNTSDIPNNWMTEYPSFDKKISFHQTKIETKDAADVVLTLDIHTLLISHPTATCFIVSADKTFLSLAQELMRRYPESDIVAERDSDNFRKDIVYTIEW